MDASSFPCNDNSAPGGPVDPISPVPMAEEGEQHGASACALFAQRTQQLYSLPAAALRVIRLTSGSDTDVRQLTAALQSDPALAARILAVVNSSVYGLREKVIDLNQAITLLGTKPLKLLVLGLSLPKDLLRVDDAEVLSGYWRHALVKSVAAREISRRFFHRRFEDEAFIAGLLQDLGMLAFVQHLGDPYVQLVKLAKKQRVRLTDAEHVALGFTHLELTAELLSRWGLPQNLVEFVRPAEDGGLAANSGTFGSVETTVRTILQMADMCASILSGATDVLPKLHELGRASCSATTADIGLLLHDLDGRARPLAAALSIDTHDWPEFRDMVDAALAALAQATAQAAPEAIDQQTLTVLARRSRELQRATATATPLEATASPSATARKSSSDSSPAEEADEDARHRLHNEIMQSASWCRAQRRPLSLLIMEFHEFQQLLGARGLRHARLIGGLVQAVVERVRDERFRTIRLNDACLGIVIRDCDRQQAVTIARQLLDHAAAVLAESGNNREALCIGVATLPMAMRNFDARDLEAAAQRCLFAARQSGGAMVKSIDLI